MQASSDRSNQEVEFLDADAASFWWAAKNRVIKVSADMPVTVFGYTLTTATAQHNQFYK